MPAFIDLSGMRFGKLTVLERDKTHYGRGDHTYWICKCDCGETTRVRPDALKSGSVVSCGCYHSGISAKIAKNINFKHGMTKSRIFHIWSGMRTRCSYKQAKNYKNYGERGIYVCDLWKESFEEFFKWSMEHGYSEDLQIDRIDNNGPYSPDNCRWVTAKENCRNKRGNKPVTVNGIFYKTISEAAENLGVSSSDICIQTKKRGRNLLFKRKGKRSEWMSAQ